MRTTTKIGEHVLAQAKAHAARSGKTLDAVVEDALREALARGGRPGSGHRIEVPTYAGGRLRSGVDLDDSAALLELTGLEQA
jgi:hypothetical protein